MLHLFCQERRVHFAVFNIIESTLIPRSCSWLRVAVLKYTYRQKPRYGFCPHPEANRLKSIPIKAWDVGEDLCRLMHTDLAVAVATLDQKAPNKALKFLGNWDIGVATALLEGHPKGLVTMASCMSNLKDQLGPLLRYAQKRFPASVDFLKFQHVAADWLLEEAEEAPASTIESKILVRLVNFDAEQRPLVEQEVREVAKQQTQADVDFVGWAKQPAVRSQWYAAQAKATTLATCLCVHMEGIQRCHASLVWRRNPGNKVLTTEALEEGAVQIPVPVTSVSALLEKTTSHHHGVTVTYELRKPAREAFVAPGKAQPTVLPKPAPAPANGEVESASVEAERAVEKEDAGEAAVAKQSEDVIEAEIVPDFDGATTAVADDTLGSDCERSGSDEPTEVPTDDEDADQFLIRCEYSVPPILRLPAAVDGEYPQPALKDSPFLFWAIKRSHENWNCELRVAEVHQVTTMPERFDTSAAQAVLTSSVVKLPVLTNTRPIAAGGELVLRWAEMPEKVKTVKTRTWQTDAVRKEAPPKKKPRH